MAGGEGTRLRPLTSNQPKPMVPIVGKPCMEHILELLRSHGFDEVVGEGTVNFTITNSSLDGLGTDTLVSIEQARLTGGTNNTRIDGSAFTICVASAASAMELARTALDDVPDASRHFPVPHLMNHQPIIDVDLHAYVIDGDLQLNLILRLPAARVDERLRPDVGAGARSEVGVGLGG